MMAVFLYIDKTDYFLDKSDVILYNIYSSPFSGYNGLIKRGEEKNMVYTADELQETVRSARPGQTISLAPGVYRTKLLITTPGLTIRGAGADKTILVWDDYAKKLDEQGREYITFRTWTVAVCADGVTMEDLAIVNDAGHPEEKGQEVALTVYSDLFTMSRCRLASTQDTLFLGPLPRDLIARYDGFLPDCLRKEVVCRQRFSHCRIEGTVDFIFGCGEAVFENCEIRSVYDVRGCGYAAAPAHEREQEKGFQFIRCRFTAEETVAPGSVYLARPWRDYGLCAFRDCRYGSHIAPAGFDKWNDTQRDRTARFYETPPVPGRVSWVRK